MSEQTTLGRGLGRAIAMAMVLGMAMFGAVVAIVIYISELHEECAPGVYIDDPPIVIIKEVGAALAFAAPIGIGLSLVLGRTLTQRTTKRLDEVIAHASALSGQRLEERLPVSGDGDALDRLALALNDALERIEVGVNEQKQFAANASHELRTPLTVISTNLEVARRKPRAASHWEHVADDALAEVRRMGDIVEKLLVLSRAGAAALKREPCELRALAAAAIERAAPAAAEHDVKLELAPGAAATADVDPGAFGIVFDNLLRNAINHSPANTAITVKVESARKLSVEDRGPGVPADMRERIFEPFARGVHQATDRAAGKGFGLGLAICQRIVEGHGGTIHVEDRPGGGARFVILLSA